MIRAIVTGGFRLVVDMQLLILAAAKPSLALASDVGRLDMITASYVPDTGQKLPL